MQGSHGTHEFYTERAHITKQLFLRGGFNAVIAESDFPDAFKVCYGRQLSLGLEVLIRPRWYLRPFLCLADVVVEPACSILCGLYAQVNLWVRGFKEGTVDDALDGFKVCRSAMPLLDSRLRM